jgi:hypothetical protein
MKAGRVPTDVHEGFFFFLAMIIYLVCGKTHIFFPIASVILSMRQR